MKRKIFKAEIASTGINIGSLFLIEEAGVNPKNNGDIINEAQIEDEITNLEVGICRTFIEIHDLNDGFRGILSEEENRIFDFYKEILDDKVFFEEIKDVIEKKKYNAHKAIYMCIQDYMDKISEGDDEYIKQRVYDLADIRKRLIKNLSDTNETKIEKIEDHHIIVMDELTPIMAAELAKRKVKGVVANRGAGYFTHSSIILRSTEIPTLNRVDFEEINKFDGRTAIIDAVRGILIVNPKEQNIKSYQAGLRAKSDTNADSRTKPGVVVPKEQHNKAETADGTQISLLANISSVRDFVCARKANIDGIGLVRTESLFINYKRVPDENKQYTIYKRLAGAMGDKPVIIRTADIGGDKVPGALAINDKSLERSSRGIKRSLEKRDEFTTQIRAILLASRFGNISISFPMVETAEEIKEAKHIINKVRHELESEKYVMPDIRIGTMIETALSVENLEGILKQVDFISIGTNDMLHQICEHNRKCSTLEKRSYLEPTMLRIIKYCIKKAYQNDRDVSICGEMATDPMGVLVLIGMGGRSLSMSPAHISGMHDFINRIRQDEAKKLAKRAMESKNLRDVKKLLSKRLKIRK